MKQIYNIVVSGILIIALCNTVASKPSNLSDLEEMQADEYDYYSEDQIGSNQQTKTVLSSGPKTFFSKSNVTITGMVGKDIILPCDQKNLKNEVVLWYKNHYVISTGKNLVSPYYSLDPKSYDLTVVNATKESQGDYYCELLPEKIRMHTTVIIAENSIEEISSESSNSSQENLSYRLPNTLIVAFGTILTLLKIIC